VVTHDKAIRSLVRAIRELMTPVAPQRRSIGFRVEEAGPACRVWRLRSASPQ